MASQDTPEAESNMQVAVVGGGDNAVEEIEAGAVA